jgi:hypothetical protein
MEWEVNKGNPDSERRQLNRILAELYAAIASLSGGSGGGWNYIAENGDIYTTEDESDLYIGGES